MSEKGCNCKAKKNADRLIKNIGDINKSSSKNYVKSNKSFKKIIYKTLKFFTYSIGIIAVFVLTVPLILYIIFSKKPITLNNPFKNKK